MLPARLTLQGTDSSVCGRVPLACALQVDLPLVPGDGLYLNRVTFDQYNRKFSKNHKPLLFNSKVVQQRVQRFKWEQIVSHIVSLEQKGNVQPCFNWLFLMAQ